MHRYLTRGAPSRYVVEKYAAAHDHVPALCEVRGWFDALLLRASRAHGLLSHLVQVYARIFAPAATARSKAVLLLAIIECCGPTLGVLQSTRRQGAVRAILTSLASMAGFGVMLLVSVAVFAPLHMLSGVMSLTSLPARGKAVREVA